MVLYYSHSYEEDQIRTARQMEASFFSGYGTNAGNEEEASETLGLNSQQLKALLDNPVLTDLLSDPEKVQKLVALAEVFAK